MEDFLNRLGQPFIDGREAALAIMNSERLDMYHTLTLIDNQVIKLIPEKLSRVLQPILSSQLPVVRSSDLPTYCYFGEQHCDALTLLSYLSKVSSQGESEVAKFAEFLSSSAIAHHK